jgi:hypothetical protein
MSVLTPIKEEKSKVHFSEYIRSEDTPAEETKPEEDTSTGSESTEPEATPANG